MKSFHGVQKLNPQPPLKRTFRHTATKTTQFALPTLLVLGLIRMFGLVFFGYMYKAVSRNWSVVFFSYSS